VAQSHGHNLTPLALLKFTLSLSKSRVSVIVLSLSHSSTLFIFSKLSLRSLFTPQTFINPIIQRYDFSPSMALPLGFLH